MDLFQWSPLTTARDIRLLSLQFDRAYDGRERAGEYSLPSWVLHHVALDEAPPYTALSYTWGSQKFTKDLFIDGNVLKVSPTTKRYLDMRQMKTYDFTKTKTGGSETEYLWIDAICINQDDHEEKSAQVRMIGDIFRGADRVIIWLDDDEDTRLGVQHLHELLEHSLFLENTYDGDSDKIRQAIDEGSYGRQNTTTDRYLSLSAFIKLLNSPYFYRTWIIQEIVVAKSATIFCGSQTVDWDVFEKFYLTLYHYPTLTLGCSLITTHVNPIMAIMGLRELHSQRPISLTYLLELGRVFNAYDPRDKIFALLGISDQSTRKSLQPDYSMSAYTLFQNVANFLFSKEESPMDLLALGTSSSKIQGLPSWVPDWSSGSQRNRVLFSAGGDSKPKFNISTDGKLLTVLGKLVDQVRSFVVTVSLGAMTGDEVGTLSTEEQWLHQCARAHSIGGWVNDCINLASSRSEIMDALLGSRSASRDTNEDDDDDDVWRTLVCNKADLGEDAASAEFGDAFKAFLKLVAAMPHPEITGYTAPDSEIARLSSDMQFMNQTARFTTALSLWITGRNFSTTENRRLAAIPADAIKGDRICVLVGARSPVVLRPAGDTYKVIGDCYVHGIMNGEALDEHDGDLGNIVLS